MSDSSFEEQRSAVLPAIAQQYADYAFEKVEEFFNIFVNNFIKAMELAHSLQHMKDKYASLGMPEFGEITIQIFGDYAAREVAIMTEWLQDVGVDETLAKSFVNAMIEEAHKAV